MQFHQIRYFLAVCDHMNFTRAAEASNVSQPALTKAIQKLEAELGGPLILRDQGRFELTPLGRAMRTHLARIEDTRRAASRAAQEIAETEMQMIDLGIMCTVGPHRLTPALSAFQNTAPNTELILHDVWSERALELLLSGAIDCALLGRREPLPDEFISHPIYREAVELTMASDHPLAKLDTIALHDLDGQAYADRLRCEFRGLFLGAIDDRRFEVEIVQRSEREDWILSTIAAGDAISIMPKYSAAESNVVSRPISDLPIEREIVFAYPANRPQRAAVRKLADFLCSYPWAGNAA